MPSHIAELISLRWFVYFTPCRYIIVFARRCRFSISAISFAPVRSFIFQAPLARFSVSDSRRIRFLPPPFFRRRHEFIICATYFSLRVLQFQPPRRHFFHCRRLFGRHGTIAARYDIRPRRRRGLVRHFAAALLFSAPSSFTPTDARLRQVLLLPARRALRCHETYLLSMIPLPFVFRLIR